MTKLDLTQEDTLVSVADAAVYALEKAGDYTKAKALFFSEYAGALDKGDITQMERIFNRAHKEIKKAR